MITSSSFTPATGLANPHLQTLLPLLHDHTYKHPYRLETIELDDGDFVDCCWLGEAENNRPVIVLFHGLEGSVESHYISGMMHLLRQRGWASMVMHFRGCSGRPNRLARSYHSGDTGDAGFVLRQLRERFPASPLAAIGYSLGGNMLLKLQGEAGDASLLSAAVSVCAPIRLDLCADRLNRGFSRLYQNHLLKHLKQKVRQKSEYIDYEKLIGMTDSRLRSIDSFWEFDDLITAPLHGFEDVHDYYARSSARQYLNRIQSDTLIIHALDDPFMTPDVVPDDSELSASVELELSETGGHIGFVSGSLLRPDYWLPQRIVDFLSPRLT